jgi:PASTA domain/Homeodomain-like domain
MNASDGLWHEGRLAWERLADWYASRRSDRPAGQPSPSPEGVGEGALSALADIGLARRLLDQAELAAVQAARRGGKSWAEIATALGVTRQSAWERWRDLDGPPEPAVAPGDAGPAGAGLAGGSIPADIASWAARRMRRQSSVAVPSVVGLTWNAANAALTAKGLSATSADPDLPLPGTPDGSMFVVTDQSPEAGARLPAGWAVRLWLDRGGGAGVREPRRPAPGPRTGRAALPEPGADALS